MEEESLLEPGYLGEVVPMWEHDLVLFDGKVDIATSLNADSALQNVGETFPSNCTYSKYFVYPVDRMPAGVMSPARTM